MTVANAFAVASFFVDASKKHGEHIDAMKLQKLLYYAQGEYLGRHGVCLFDEPLEAWTYGPVQPDVYRCLKRNDPLPGELPPSEVREFLREIFNEYGVLSGAELSEMTHSERPWIKTRGSLPPDQPSNRNIPIALLRSFFEKSLSDREEYALQIRIGTEIINRDRAVFEALAAT